MGSAASILDALSCKTLYTHVLNAMTCESHCGICGCRCHTDEVDVEQDDVSVDLETCCGTLHYVTLEKEAEE